MGGGFVEAEKSFAMVRKHAAQLQRRTIRRCGTLGRALAKGRVLHQGIETIGRRGGRLRVQQPSSRHGQKPLEPTFHENI